MSENKNNVPKRRFKEFENAEAWEHRKLGDLADIVRGASPRPIQDPKWFDDRSTVGWLRISDVSEQDGRIHFLEQHLSKDGQEKTRVLMQSHLLLSIAASVGKPVINYVSTGVHDGFLIFQNPTFDQEFMFQWMKMFESQWQKYGQPGSQVNLNSDIVKNQVILIPKEEEQVKIGTFFSDIDNLITLHQHKLEKMKALKKAYLTDMFPDKGERKPKLRFAGFTDDWEQRKLGEIVEFLDEQRKPLESGTRESGEYPYYGASGIIDYVKDYLFDEELILLSEDGANIVDRNYRVCFLASGKYWVNNHAHVLKSKDNYCNGFICEALERLDYVQHNTGTAQPKLNQEVCRNIIIMVPNLKEQQRISSYLVSLDNLITLHQHKLDKLQNTKKAYLNEMFI